MRVIAWNMFRGYYVVRPDESVFDGYEFLFWDETIEECEAWIEERKGSICTLNYKGLYLYDL